MPRPPSSRSPVFGRRLRMRWRRSAIAWWACAAGLALVTGLVVDASLGRLAAVESRFGGARSVPVVVVAVAEGDVVPDGAVEVQMRPAATLPADAVARDAVGRIALVPLIPGEVLVVSKLAPHGLRGAAALLPPGTRALAVPSGPGGRPPAAVGDRVDVLATFADAASGPNGEPTGDPTVLVVASALVVAIDREADTVTIAVPAADVPAVAYAITAGVVTLALTAP